jgi:hypothetical protein
MTIFHGTDRTSAEKIMLEKLIPGDGVAGPVISLTLEDAINHCREKCGDELKKDGRIIMIHNMPSQIINTASKKSAEGFALNDELGKPSAGLPFTRVRVMTMADARYWLNTPMFKNEFNQVII